MVPSFQLICNCVYLRNRDLPSSISLLKCHQLQGLTRPKSQARDVIWVFRRGSRDLASWLSLKVSAQTWTWYSNPGRLIAMQAIHVSSQLIWPTPAQLLFIHWNGCTTFKYKCTGSNFENSLAVRASVWLSFNVKVHFRKMSCTK